MADVVAIVTWIVKNGIAVAVLGFCLFASSGRLNWTAGWVYLSFVLASQVLMGFVLFVVSPDLLAERATLKAGAKMWDKVLAPLVAWGPLAIAVVAGLDVRFEWAPAFLWWLQTPGLAVAGLGVLLLLWAMASNRFFSAVVRIQTDRGHSVASSGPYRAVRHPGYLALLGLQAGTPFILGSRWALVPAAVTMALTLLRTALEDRTLTRELAGYAEYAGRVRYRLFPGIY